MQTTFEEFMERLAKCFEEKDFRETMSVTLTRFNISKFAYVSFVKTKSNNPKVITNYPDKWAAKYLKNTYHRIDPVLRRVGSSDEPFHWPTEDNAPDLAKHGSFLFEEAAAFGICRGFTIPIHDRGGQVAAMTYAADEADDEFLQTTRDNTQALQLLATCLHIKARDETSNAKLVDGVHLTNRELECLQWASRGKSAGVTAEILGIKTRTVRFHLNNVRRKFNVGSINQAITIMAVSRPDLTWLHRDKL